MFDQDNLKDSINIGYEDNIWMTSAPTSSLSFSPFRGSPITYYHYPATEKFLKNERSTDVPLADFKVPRLGNVLTYKWDEIIHVSSKVTDKLTWLLVVIFLLWYSNSYLIR